MKTGGRKSRGFESHPLRHISRRLAAAGIVAAILAGCGLLPPRTFALELPAAGALGPVPVVLTDRSGAVVGIEVGPEDVAAPIDAGMTAANGLPNAIALFWMGGVCGERVDMTATTSGGNVDFVVTTTVRPGDCEMMGIVRRVLVHLSGPADLSRLAVRFERR